jgi:hypothetical protein
MKKPVNPSSARKSRGLNGHCERSRDASRNGEDNLACKDEEPSRECSEWFPGSARIGSSGNDGSEVAMLFES